MITTAQRTPTNDSTYDNTPVPILMRLPDLSLPGRQKAIAPEVAAPATKPVVELPPEPIAPAASESIASEPEPSTLATLVTMVEHEIEQATRPTDEEPAAEPAAKPMPAAVETPASVEIKAAAETKIEPTAATTETPPTTTAPPPVTRRDRAQERLRRQQVEPAPKSWWRSHAPMILIGFVIALGITLYVAKQKRAQDRPAPDTWVNEETPDLNIEMNAGSGELPVIENVATPDAKSVAETTPADAPVNADELPKREKKSPPLLSADATIEPTAPPVAEATTPVEDAKTEVTSTTTPDSSPTDPGESRPGNRVATLPEKTGADASAADVPTYPVTNFPSTWR